MPVEIDLDKVFCMMGKRHSIPKLLLKAVGIAESALRPVAYRFEPKFWENYLMNNPDWKDRDPKEVSASYGICQVLYTTAVMLGFPKNGNAEDLYNPVINIDLGAKLLRRLLDGVKGEDAVFNYPWLSPLYVALCRYNGGSQGNPSANGTMRNKDYADKVLSIWQDLKKKESECP